jgi:peptidoglycan/LPS O-acetylase OafA/YrhL
MVRQTPLAGAATPDVARSARATGSARAAAPSDAAAPDVVAPPAGNPRFEAIDAMRGLAILSVIAYHADQLASPSGTYPINTVLGRALSHVDVAVAVFFAITGFLLYRPFFAASIGDAPRVPTRVYYWRRLLRIVPAYWLALIVLAPILTYAHSLGLPNFPFAQVYDPSQARSGIEPAWSVCVEMSFYILLPASGSSRLRCARSCTRSSGTRTTSTRCR